MTKADRFIIVLFIVSAAAALVFLNFAVYSGEPVSVVISVAGKEYAKYALDDIDEPMSVEVDTEYGSNLIEISHDGARVIEASCRDKLDVKAGMITKSNQVIVCAPNKLSVRIVGEENEVDGVAY